MARLRLDISMSLDGFVAGPDASLDAPLGEGGELLHEWAYPLRSWREEHGEAGGVRLFDDHDGGPLRLEPTRVLSSAAVAHLRYRVT